MGILNHVYEVLERLFKKRKHSPERMQRRAEKYSFLKPGIEQLEDRTLLSVSPALFDAILTPQSRILGDAAQIAVVNSVSPVDAAPSVYMDIGTGSASGLIADYAQSVRAATAKGPNAFAFDSPAQIAQSSYASYVNNHPAASNVVFIDGNVPNYDELIQSFGGAASTDAFVAVATSDAPAAGPSVQVARFGDTDVVVLDSGYDGIQQITSVLKNYHGLTSEQVVSHGGVGEVQLGSTILDKDTLVQNQAAIASWGQALLPDGDLLLFGCDVAQGSAGTQFVQSLAQITGADVAASTNLTGASALGGDWNLEYSTGAIEARQIFNGNELTNYGNVLLISLHTYIQDLLDAHSASFTSTEPVIASATLVDTTGSLGGFLQLNQVTLTVNATFTSGVWSGTVGIAADTAALYSGTSFSASITTLTGTYTIGAGYALSASQMSLRIGEALAITASGVNLAYNPAGAANQTLVTLSTATVTSAQFAGMPTGGTLSNFKLRADGFAFDAFTLNSVGGSTPTIGNFFKTTSVALTVSAFDAKFGSLLDSSLSAPSVTGTIGIAITGLQLFPTGNYVQIQSTGVAAAYSFAGFNGTSPTGQLSVTVSGLQIAMGDALNLAATADVVLKPGQEVVATIGSLTVSSPRFTGLGTTTLNNIEIHPYGFSLGNLSWNRTGAVTVGGDILSFTGVEVTLSNFVFDYVKPTAESITWVSGTTMTLQKIPFPQSTILVTSTPSGGTITTLVLGTDYNVGTDGNGKAQIQFITGHIPAAGVNIRAAYYASPAVAGSMAFTATGVVLFPNIPLLNLNLGTLNGNFDFGAGAAPGFMKLQINNLNIALGDALTLNLGNVIISPGLTTMLHATNVKVTSNMLTGFADFNLAAFDLLQTGFNLGTFQISLNAEVKIGNFISFANATINVNNFKVDKSLSNVPSGSITVTLGTMTLFPGNVAVTSTFTGLTGSFDFTSLTTPGRFSLSATKIVLSLFGQFTLEADGITITPALDTLATFATAKLVFAPLNNLTFNVSNVEIKKSGFSIGNASGSIADITFGNLLKLTAPTVTLSDIAYTFGGGLRGTVGLSATGTTLHLGSGTSFDVAVASSTGSYDLVTKALSLTLTTFDVDIAGFAKVTVASAALLYAPAADNTAKILIGATGVNGFVGIPGTTQVGATLSNGKLGLALYKKSNGDINYALDATGKVALVGVPTGSLSFPPDITTTESVVWDANSGTATTLAHTDVVLASVVVKSTVSNVETTLTAGTHYDLVTDTSGNTKVQFRTGQVPALDTRISTTYTYKLAQLLEFRKNNAGRVHEVIRVDGTPANDLHVDFAGDETSAMGRGLGLTVGTFATITGDFAFKTFADGTGTDIAIAANNVDATVSAGSQSLIVKGASLGLIVKPGATAAATTYALVVNGGTASVEGVTGLTLSSTGLKVRVRNGLDTTSSTLVAGLTGLSNSISTPSLPTTAVESTTWTSGAITLAHNPATLVGVVVATTPSGGGAVTTLVQGTDYNLVEVSGSIQVQFITGRAPVPGVTVGITYSYLVPQTVTLDFSGLGSTDVTDIQGQATISVAGFASLSGDFGFQKFTPTTGPVTFAIGAKNVTSVMGTSTGANVTVTAGTLGMLIQGDNYAVVATGNAALNNVPGLTVTANNVKVKVRHGLNISTVAGVPVVQTSATSAGDVTLDFTGLGNTDVTSIEGDATLTVANFGTLAGKFGFQAYKDGGTGAQQFAIGATDVTAILGTAGTNLTLAHASFGLIVRPGSGNDPTTYALQAKGSSTSADTSLNGVTGLTLNANNLMVRVRKGLDVSAASAFPTTIQTSGGNVALDFSGLGAGSTDVFDVQGAVKLTVDGFVDLEGRFGFQRYVTGTDNYYAIGMDGKITLTAGTKSLTLDDVSIGALIKRDSGGTTTYALQAKASSDPAKTTFVGPGGLTMSASDFVVRVKRGLDLSSYSVTVPTSEVVRVVDANAIISLTNIHAVASSVAVTVDPSTTALVEGNSGSADYTRGIDSNGHITVTFRAGHLPAAGATVRIRYATTDAPTVVNKTESVIIAGATAGTFTLAQTQGNSSSVVVTLNSSTTPLVLGSSGSADYTLGTDGSGHITVNFRAGHIPAAGAAVYIGYTYQSQVPSIALPPVTKVAPELVTVANNTTKITLAHLQANVSSVAVTFNGAAKTVDTDYTLGLDANGFVTVNFSTAQKPADGVTVRINYTYQSQPASNVALNFGALGTGTTDVTDIQGHAKITVANFASLEGDFGFQKYAPTANAADDTFVIGGKNIKAVMGTADTNLTVTNGEFGLIVQSGNYALVTNAGTIALNGVPDLSLSASNLQVRVRRGLDPASITGATGAPTVIHTTGGDVTLSFAGLAGGTTDITAIQGTATINVANFASLSGTFSFSTATVGSVTKILVGGSGVNAFVGSSDGALGLQITGASFGLAIFRDSTQVGAKYALKATAPSITMVGLPGDVNLTGAATVSINTTGVAVNETIPAGTNVVFATGANIKSFGGSLTLAIGSAFTLSGDFSITKTVVGTVTKLMIGAANIVTNGSSSVAATVGGATFYLSAGSLGLVFYRDNGVDKGYALNASAKATATVGNVSANATLSIRRNTTTTAQNDTVTVGATSIPVVFTATQAMTIALSDVGLNFDDSLIITAATGSTSSVPTGASNTVLTGVSLMLKDPGGPTLFTISADSARHTEFTGTVTAAAATGNGLTARADGNSWAAGNYDLMMSSVNFTIGSYISFTADSVDVQHYTDGGGGEVNDFIFTNATVAFLNDGTPLASLSGNARFHFTTGGPANGRGFRMDTFTVTGFSLLGETAALQASGGGTGTGTPGSTTNPRKLGPVTLVSPSISLGNFSFDLTGNVAATVTVSAATAKIDVATNVSATFTTVSASFVVALDFDLSDLTALPGGSVSAFTMSADRVDIKLGQYVTLSATSFTLNPMAAASEDFITFGSLSATLAIPSIGLSFNGGASNFAITGDGTFVAKTDFAVTFGFTTIATAGDASAKLKWPSWLPLKSLQVALVWPDFNANKSQFLIQLSAAVELTSLKGVPFVVTGGITDCVIDPDMLSAGKFPIISIGSGVLSVSGNLYAAEVSGTLIFGVVRYDSLGQEVDGFGNLRGTTTPGTGALQSAFYGAIAASFTIGGSMSFAIRIGLSEYGPLEIYISAGVPVPLGPTTLFLSDFRGGIKFNATFPPITITPANDPNHADDALQLRGPGFVTPSELTATEWESQLRGQVLNQARSGATDGWSNFGNGAVIIQAGMTLYSTNKNAFRIDGDIFIDTSGKFLVIGTGTFGNNLTIGVKLYTDLSKVFLPLSDPNHRASADVLFLIENPAQNSTAGQLLGGPIYSVFGVLTIKAESPSFKIELAGAFEYRVLNVVLLRVQATVTLTFTSDSFTIEILNAAVKIPIISADPIGTASGKLTIRTRNGTVELFGAFLMSTNFTFMEQFGITVGGQISIQLNTTNDLQNVTLNPGFGGPITIGLVAKSFRVFINGYADFVILGVKIFRLSGTLAVEITDDHLSMFVAASLLMGSDSANPIMTFNANGLVHVQIKDVGPVKKGFAAKITLTTGVVVPGITIGANWLMVANTTESTISYTIPDPIPTSPPSHAVATVMGPDYNSSNILGLTSYETIVSGKRTLIIPSGKPNGTLSNYSTWTPASTSKYFMILGRGEINIANTITLSGNLNIMGEISGTTVSFIMAADAKLAVKLQGNTIFAFDVAGRILINNKGIAAAIAMGFSAGTSVPSSLGFGMSASFRLELNTTNEDVTISGVTIAGTQKVLIRGEGHLTFLGNIVDLFGKFNISIQSTELTVDIDAKVTFLGATFNVVGFAGIYYGTNPGLALNIALGLPGGARGIAPISALGSQFVISGDFTLQLNTSSITRNGIATGFMVSINNLGVYFFGFNLTGSVTISINTQGFGFSVNLTLDFFSLASINITGYYRPSGEYYFSGTASFALGARPLGIGGSITVSAFGGGSLGTGFSITVSGWAAALLLEIDISATVAFTGTSVDVTVTFQVQVVPAIHWYTPAVYDPIWGVKIWPEIDLGWTDAVYLATDYTFHLGEISAPPAVAPITYFTPAPAPPPTPPHLAGYLIDTNHGSVNALQLYLGQDVNLRVNDDTPPLTTGAQPEENYSLRRVSGDTGSTFGQTIIVSALNFEQTYINVQEIIVTNTLTGNDSIYIDTAISVPVYVTLGSGNNNLTTGSGAATVVVQGAGNNAITTSNFTSITVDAGGTGTNTIATGTSSSFTINATGSNSNTITAGASAIVALNGNAKATITTGNSSAITVASGATGVNLISTGSDSTVTIHAAGTGTNTIAVGARANVTLNGTERNTVNLSNGGTSATSVTINGTGVNTVNTSGGAATITINSSATNNNVVMTNSASASIINVYGGGNNGVSSIGGGTSTINIDGNGANRVTTGGPATVTLRGSGNNQVSTGSGASNVYDYGIGGNSVTGGAGGGTYYYGVDGSGVAYASKRTSFASSTSGNLTVDARGYSTYQLSDFVLSSGSYLLGLSGIRTAILSAATATTNTFTLATWTGNATLNGVGTTNKLINVPASNVYGVNYVLSDTSLQVTGGVTQTITLNSIQTADLYGAAGTNNFNISAWTGNGSLHGVGATNTLIATNDIALFTLSNTLFTRTGRGNMTLDNIQNAILTGGGIVNTFTVNGWTGNANLFGLTDNDIYNITLTGSGSGVINVSDSAGSADTLNIYVSNTTLVTSTYVRVGTQRVNYLSSGIEFLNVIGGSSAGNLTYNVQGTSSSVISTVQTTGNTNVINVSSTAGVPLPTPGTLDGILGLLAILGGSSLNNLLRISDLAGTTGKTVTLTDASITGFAPARIDYSVSTGTFANTSGVADGIKLEGSSTTATTFNIQSTLQGSTTWVQASSSNDVFNIGTTGNSLGQIKGLLTVQGGTGSGDLVGSTTLSASSAPASLNPSRTLPVGDIVNFNDQGDNTTGFTYALTSSTLDRSDLPQSTPAITYGNVETVNVNTGLQSSNINVTSTAANVNTTVKGSINVSATQNAFNITATGIGSNNNFIAGTGDTTFKLQSTGTSSFTQILGNGGNDSVLVSSNAIAGTAGNTDAINATLSIDAGAGNNNRIVLDDTTGVTRTNVVVHSDAITGLTPANIFYTATGGHFANANADIWNGILINGSNSGGNTFNVRSTRGGSTTEINGGGANDTFNVSSDAGTNVGTLAGIQGHLTVIGGTGNANRLIISDFGNTTTAAVKSNIIQTEVTLAGRTFQQVQNFAGTVTSGVGATNINYAAVGGFNHVVSGVEQGDGIALVGSNTLANRFTFRTTVARSTVAGKGGNADDTFNIGSPLTSLPGNTGDNGDLDKIQGRLRIVAGTPTGTDEGDRIFIDDYAKAGRANYLITPTTVTSLILPAGFVLATPTPDSSNFNPTRPLFAGIDYDGATEFLNLVGNDSVNVFNVQPSADTEFSFDGRLPVPGVAVVSGGDYLLLDTQTTATTGRKLHSTGLGQGFWDFTSAHQRVNFQSMERFNHVDIIASPVLASATSQPTVTVKDAETGEVKFQVTAYENTYHGSVQVATGDVDLDGIPDLIVATGANHSPLVKVYHGSPNENGAYLAAEEYSFLAYASQYLDGVNVAVGDINADGAPDIITSPFGNATPDVHVYAVATSQGAVQGTSLRNSFLAFPNTYRGQVTLAVGDINNDGYAEIVTGGQPVSGSTVKVFNGNGLGLVNSFAAFSETNHGAVYVAIGDFNQDRQRDIITSAAPGFLPKVRVYEGANIFSGTAPTLLTEFLATVNTNRAGVPVQVAPINGGNPGFVEAIQVSTPFGDFTRSTTNGAAGTGLTINPLNSTSTTNVSVQADVSLAAIPGVQVAGLIARYQGADDKDMYLGALYADGSGSMFATIYRNLNGNWTLLASQGLGLVTTSPQLLRFDVVNESLKLFVNGSLKVWTIDSSLSGTGTSLVGTRTYTAGATGATYANLSATAITPATAVISTTFTDNFSTVTNTNQLNLNWRENVGNFTVAGGTLTTNAGLAIATLNGVSQANVVVSDSVTLSAGQYGGLVARYSGSGDTNMYWGMLHNSGLGYIASIYRNVNGTWTELVTKSLNLSAGVKALRFEVLNTNLSFFVDNTLSVYTNDSALTTGSVGLRSTQGAVWSGSPSFTAGVAAASISLASGFTEPFSNAVNYGANWRENLGSFTLDTVTRTLTTNAERAVATLYGVSQADVVVADSVTLASGQYGGLVARYSGSGDKNMYWGTLHRDVDSYSAEIYRNVNGTWTQLGSTSVDSTLPNNARSLRFEVIGESLKLFVNNGLALSVNDSLLTTGSVGLRSTVGAVWSGSPNFSAAVPTPLNTVTLTTTPFTDDFSTTSSLNWRENVGTFTRGTGTLITSTGSAVTGSAVTTLNGVSQADVVVADSVTLSSGQYGGLVARYSGSGDKNMYWGTLYRNGSSYFAEIYRNVNGTWTQLGSTSVDSTLPNNARSLRFEVIGESLKLFVNNGLVLSVNDSLLTTGSVGLRSTVGAVWSGSPNFSAAVPTPLNTVTLTTTPFTDDFSTTSSLNWRENVGTFTRGSGTLITSTGSAVTKSAVTTLNGVSQANVVVADSVTLASGQYGGLVARYSGYGDKNMYWGTLYRNGSSYFAYIYRNVNGTWTLLTSTAVDASLPDNARALRFEVINDSLKLFVNNALVLFVTDSLLTTGSVGLRSTQGAVWSGSPSFSAAVRLPLAPPAAPLSFSDDFSTSNYNGATNTQTAGGNELGLAWKEQVGAYSVGSGLATGVGGLNLAVVNTTQTDFTLTANVTLPVNQYFGLIARYSGTGDTNMYWGAVSNFNGQYVAYIFKNVDGAWTKLREQYISMFGGLIEFDVIGSTLTLKLDSGVNILSVNDTSLTSGKAGIRSTAGASVTTFTAN